MQAYQWSDLDTGLMWHTLVCLTRSITDVNLIQYKM